MRQIKRSVLLVSSFLLVGSLFSEIFTIRAADDIVWKKELLGKATAYISVAEDIEMARATNAVKRQVGKSVGVDFPKMNVITEYQEEAKKLFETNDESWLFANKTGGRYSSPHVYPVPVRAKTPGTMELGSQETSAFTVRDRVKFYFSESNNSGAYASVTGSAGSVSPMAVGHSITQFEATGIGSVISIDGTGQSLPDLKAPGYSLSYVDPDAWTKLTTSSDGYKAAVTLLGKFHHVGELIDKATDEDNPKVDGKNISSSSQVDKNTIAIDSTGRGYKFSEDLIPNMPKDRDFKDDITTMKFLTPAKFENAEVYSINKWQEEVTGQVEDVAIHWLRVKFMLVGVLFCLVGGFLLLLYVFDRWSWFPFSTMGAITGGRVRVAMDVNEYENGYHVIEAGGKKVKIVNFTWIVMWSFIFMAVGVYVMSGGLYQFLTWLTTTVKWFKF